MRSPPSWWISTSPLRAATCSAVTARGQRWRLASFWPMRAGDRRECLRSGGSRRPACRSRQPALAAGFEEEGVPLVVEYREGEAKALAREAAGRSPLGLGIGSDARALVLVLATWPGRPYLSGEPSEARAFGRAAARLAVGRPLGDIVAGPAIH